MGEAKSKSGPWAGYDLADQIADKEWVGDVAGYAATAAAVGGVLWAGSKALARAHPAIRALEVAGIAKTIIPAVITHASLARWEAMEKREFLKDITAPDRPKNHYDVGGAVLAERVASGAAIGLSTAYSLARAAQGVATVAGAVAGAMPKLATPGKMGVIGPAAVAKVASRAIPVAGAAPTPPAKGGRSSKVLGALGVGAVGVGMLYAANKARAEGAGAGGQAVAAAKSGGRDVTTQAATGLGMAGAAGLLVRAGMGVTPAGLIVGGGVMAGQMAKGAWDRRSEGASGMMRGAYDGSPVGQVASLVQSGRSAVAERFNAANSAYTHTHMGLGHDDPAHHGNDNHARGTQNEANLKAIIANKQQRAAERMPE